MLVSQMIGEKGGSVMTIRPAETIASAAAILSEHRIGALIASNDGNRIEGILSERDIVRLIAEEGSACLKKHVSDAMTSDVITCEPGQSVHDVMELMTNGRFRHLPVVDNGRLAGIISIGDVVKRKIAEAEREAADMRAYISAG